MPIPPVPPTEHPEPEHWWRAYRQTPEDLPATPMSLLAFARRTAIVVLALSLMVTLFQAARQEVQHDRQVAQRRATAQANDRAGPTTVAGIDPVVPCGHYSPKGRPMGWCSSM